MAIFKALTFDGVNSLDYGIYITGEAVYNAPERAVEMINIPGKNGALALDQGRFENIEVTYRAGCFADSQADFADKVMKFRNALASRYTYKRLTDEYHSDEYRLGLYKSGLDLDAVRYGTAGEFDIEFDCKPQRFLVDGDREISPTEWSDVQTESGELVTIESDGSLAVRSLSVSLSPIQDLNGYDKPWVGGAGKNKLDTSGMSTAGQTGVTFSRASDGTITVGGKANTTVYRTIGSIQTENGVQYTITGVPSGGASGKYRMTLVGYGCDYGSGYTFTGDGNSHAIVIDIYTGYPSSGTLTFKPMIRLASVSDATYEPYENICPISGRTEVVTHRTGKNLFPVIGGTVTNNGITALIDTENWTVTLNGSNPNSTAFINLDFRGAMASSAFDVSKLVGSSLKAVWNDVPTVETGNMTFQFGAFTADSWRSRGSVYNARPTFEFSYQDGDLYGRSYLQIPQGNSFSNQTIQLPMICLASDSDNVEPYNGNTYTTALGRTVYGGSLDVVSGVLTVDRAMVTLNGSETWAASNGTATACMRVQTRTNVGFKPNTSNASLMGDISSAFVEVTTNQTWDGTIGFSVSIDANPYLHFCQTGQKNMSVEAWKTYLASNPIQVVGLLATPQTYQLTSQQIDLLLGTNHLWSDGEVTVEYGVHPYYNPTPFDAKPLIKVTGTGTLGIGEYILTITGTASQTLYIDCETMEIYTLEGTVPTGASSLVSINKNDFPVLEPGTNCISVGSGITAVTITPRWWRI